MQVSSIAQHVGVLAKQQAGRSRSFAQLLNSASAQSVDLKDNVENKKAQAREAAEQLVASTLIIPVLSQARKDPFKSEMFHGGFAEDAFGAQLDTMFADQIAGGQGMQPLVNMIYDKLTGDGVQRSNMVDTNG